MKDNKHKKVCIHSFANELGRFSQGVGKIFKGTDTIFFVDYNDIPSNRHKEITYVRVVLYYRPQKLRHSRTRLTVGGGGSHWIPWGCEHTYC